MTNEDLYLNNRMGKKNPFTVPEGYFSQLAGNIMAQLPEKQQPTIFRRLRPWLYAAACICVAVFSVTLYLNSEKSSPEQQPVAAIEQQIDNYYNDYYMDEEADYAMVDNQEIYAYLLAEM